MNPARPPQNRNAPPPRKDSLQNRNRPGILKRTPSIQSDASSDDSASTARSPTRPAPAPSPYHGDTAAAASTSTLASQVTRPTRKVSYDVPSRGTTPAMVQQAQHGHRRQHSQGFFEPSLSTAHSPAISTLSASQIAAQAAMHVQNSLHARRRSQTAPIDNSNNSQQSSNPQSSYQRKPSTLSIQTSDSSNPNSRAPSQTRSTSGNGGQAGNAQTTSTAREGAVAAVAAKSPLPSPLLQQGHQVASPTIIGDRDPKPAKEKSRMKIFSKPKALNVSGSKDQEKKTVTIQSPKRPGIYPSHTMPLSSNRSLVSLAESTMTGASSFYSTANNSTSTLMPSDRATGAEKEKPRHHFLSRQRNKLKEGAEHYSSAASNSRPTDPNGPQPLYSFAPSSPGPGTTFGMTKSKTGLDLRHGGRALREKKREEKAAAGTFVPPSALAASEARERETPSHEWGAGGTPFSNVFGPPSTGPQNAELASGLGSFGLPGMTVEDAWPLLKARLLNIFEGVDIRTPIEDFNKLVLAHLQRCVQHQIPSLIIEDLRELLQTGFYSLDQILRRIPDDRLVPHLVDTWSFVFGTVLPFVQAVFHPLDLEFKGQGQILSPKDAREFWGALPFASKPAPTAAATSMGPPPRPSTATNTKAQPTLFPLHSVLSVRTIALLTFRDTIILPRYDLLLSTFGRLPLENLNATAALETPRSPPPFRPGTATSSNSSHNLDPITASFNSQSSTLLDSSTASSLGARSRATSNTSAISSGSAVGSFHFSSPRPHAGSSGSASAKLPPMPTPRSYVPPGVPSLDSAKVTQTAGKMLQCVSVLAGLQAPGIFSTIASGATPTVAKNEDGEQVEAEARRKMEELGKVLKLNWLGRSRTGRNRRGLVGTTRTPGTAVGVAA